jgi:hypothetical protein
MFLSADLLAPIGATSMSAASLLLADGARR